MTDPVRVTGHPSHVGGLLALLVGALAVAAVADAWDQLVALAGELAALVALSVGVWRLRHGEPIVGAALVAAGGLGVAVAVGYGAVSAARTTQLLELVPGLVGLGFMALGLLPIRPARSRALVAAGAIAIAVGIVTSGVVHEAGRLRLLAGMALAVVAWDAAEQAVNLGEQVGSRAADGAVVVTHGAWSLGVGVAGVALAIGVSTVDVTGVPLVGVGLLLAGTVALASAAFT